MNTALLSRLRAPIRLLRKYPPPTTRPSPQPRHAFSTGSGTLLAGHTLSITSRAIGYEKHGDPCEEGILDVLEYEVPRLQKGQVRLRFERSALNPADINVIQGVYPTQPTAQTINGRTFTVMGNEGTAIVEGFEEDGKVEHEFNVGDRVVMAKAQMGTFELWLDSAYEGEELFVCISAFRISRLIPDPRRNSSFTHKRPNSSTYQTGTWQTYLNAVPSELIRLPPSSQNPTSATRLTASQAATLCINPPTAFRMLSDNLSINPTSSSSRSQWVIQNGANSAVGESVIQLARIWGIKTVNLVRARSTEHETERLKEDLKALGADVVLTYDEFLGKGGMEEVGARVGKEEGGQIKLALNCVGGDEIKGMLKVLDRGANLVTYGGMAKKALNLSPSMFIFKDLTAKGFWLSNWVKQQNDNGQARLEMMHQLVSFIEAGQFVTPKVEIVSLGPKSGLSIEEAKIRVREVMKRQMKGRAKKVLFDFE